MKIGLIGAGRLGICLALLMEKAGYDIVVSDIRETYVSRLNERRIETNEPEVANLLKEAKNFRATTSNREVIEECDIIFVMVQTPSLEDGSYDVSAVDSVISDINSTAWATTGPNGSPVCGKTVVIGCTTNPGNCDRWKEKLDDMDIAVYYNPEFIAQGSIIRDLQNADMVLIGGYGHHIPVIEEIYEKIQVKEPSIHYMTNKAAELVKLAVNCYLTTKISYANMLGEVMTLSGMENEIDNVLGAIGADSRVGTKYLNYGYGFGGPCLPRDNRAFAHYAEKVGLKHNLGLTTDNFNNEHAGFLKNYYIERNGRNLPFFFECIAYKKGTDILEESQQYRLCRDLLDSGYKVFVLEKEFVIEQVYDELLKEYPTQIHFVYDEEYLPEEVFRIKL